MVDRWSSDSYGDMYDYREGKYVLWTDYDALRARLAESERLLRLMVEDYADNVGQARREVREYIARASETGCAAHTENNQ